MKEKNEVKKDLHKKFVEPQAEIVKLSPAASLRTSGPGPCMAHCGAFACIADM